VNETASDLVLPFLIGAGAIRGRVVRLSAALDEVLAGHAYPPVVAERLAETLALVTVLAGGLKFDGIFTLQIQADGPIPLVVADVTSDGDLRGYARYDTDRLAAAAPGVPCTLGKGFLAFTVDQGPDTDRYQGIVDLAGDTLAQCALRYFAQSEQLDTALDLAVRPPLDGDGWRAAAIVIQRMPLRPRSPILTGEEAQELWNRAVVLMGSMTTAELFDRQLPLHRLLHRLYHGERLALHPARPIRARCRCSAERVAGTLKSFPQAEIESMKDEDGRIVVVCEFCKSQHIFSGDQLNHLYAS
jgi:molecular chaperone Hsp33